MVLLLQVLLLLVLWKQNKKMTYKEVARRLDRIEEKQDVQMEILRDGTGKIASNRTAINYLKIWIGAVAGSLLTFAIWIIGKVV